MGVSSPHAKHKNKNILLYSVTNVDVKHVVIRAFTLNPLSPGTELHACELSTKNTESEVEN